VAHVTILRTAELSPYSKVERGTFRKQGDPLSQMLSFAGSKLGSKYK
jgi:hypothetical protein